jgi:hypothetical protein
MTVFVYTFTVFYRSEMNHSLNLFYNKTNASFKNNDSVYTGCNQKFVKH